MTAEELIHQIDDCYGPCDLLCLSCPESRYLKEIREVVVALMEERDKYKKMIEIADQWGEWMQLCDKYHIQWHE